MKNHGEQRGNAGKLLADRPPKMLRVLIGTGMIKFVYVGCEGRRIECRKGDRPLQESRMEVYWSSCQKLVNWEVGELLTFIGAKLPYGC